MILGLAKTIRRTPAMDEITAYLPGPLGVERNCASGSPSGFSRTTPLVLRESRSVSALPRA